VAQLSDDCFAFGGELMSAEAALVLLKTKLAPVPDDAGAAALPSGVDGATVPGNGSVVPSTAFLVYLFKRGTFYPFVPDGPEHRDNAAELRLQSLVAGDLAVEPELDRWFPLWDLPLG